MKALAWRAVPEGFVKSQPTTSRKSLESVHEQLYRLWPVLVYCPHVVLFARRGYKHFKEAGNKCGLIHSCGGMYTALQ